MMRQKIQTEHSGAKKCKGYWGRKKEAKRVCRKKRRALSKFIIQSE